MKIHREKIKQLFAAAGSPQFLVGFISIWVALILFSGIRVGDLSGYDDAAYAHEAKVMLKSGDWWTLNLNGNPDFDKPPLFIWLIVLSFKIFGMSDFAAKVPGVILGWGTILMTYFLTKELYSQDSEENKEWIPPLAMFVLATTQYFLKYSSHAMTDVPFTFFFTAAIFFYLVGLKKNIFLLLSGASIGLCLLMRSPMGVFPLPIIIAHLIFTKRVKNLFSSYFIGLLLISAVIPSTWYLVEYRLFGDLFVSRHLGNLFAHSGASTDRTPIQQLLWYFEYFFKLSKLYLPWFPFMLYGLYLSLKKWHKGKSAGIESLLFIWLLMVIVPFSLAESKVLRYILPVFPVFSIYTASAILKVLTQKYLPSVSQIVIIILLFAGCFIVFFPKYQERAGDMKTLAPLTDQVTKAEERVVLYTFGDLHWNYQTQLIWYGDRNCLLIKDIREIDDLLNEKKQITLIIDRESFNNLLQTKRLEIKYLGESEKFVALRISLN